MIELLPNKIELSPIINDWETFYDSNFNDDFDNLDFKSKLQILVDIVRQTIMYNEYPNPLDEEQKLIGDSYSACKILVNYLHKMNIGYNYRIILTSDSLQDINPTLSTHFMVLVDNEKKVYQADCSPSIGYKRGCVEELKSIKNCDYYEVLNSNYIDSLNKIRMINYNIVNTRIDDCKIYKYLDSLKQIQNNIIINGFVYKCLKLLYLRTNSIQLKKDIVKLSNQLLLQKINKEKILKNNLFYSNNDSYKQIKVMREELNTLISEDKNYRRQLEITQCIMYEIIKYNKEYDKKLVLENKVISYININPRLFAETGYNVVLLKPSAYMSNVDSIIKEKYSKDNYIGKYYVNLGEKSKIMGLKPMRLFHPIGYKYERSMYGPGELFLIKEKSDEIRKTKKELRASLAKEFEGKTITWYDGKEIYWDSKMFNLVHTTDNPSEAALHYLAGYPEYQVMTRFMYPNPKLGEFERKKKL